VAITIEGTTTGFTPDGSCVVTGTSGVTVNGCYFLTVSSRSTAGFTVELRSPAGPSGPSGALNAASQINFFYIAIASS
jgi:hypothetical protein